MPLKRRRHRDLAINQRKNIFAFEGQKRRAISHTRVMLSKWLPEAIHA